MPTPRPSLVVVTHASARVRARPDGLTAEGTDIAGLTSRLDAARARLVPLFGDEERLRTAAQAPSPTGLPVPDLSVFYRVELADDDLLEGLAARLREEEAVDGAYVVPPAEPPVVEGLNDMRARPVPPPATTPDFSAGQGYLDAGPGGIDARHAWTVPGGEGTGVGIIDIEYGFRFTHEDLLQHQGGVIGGSPSTDDHHGTAVLGELGGDRNGFGVTGICPRAHLRAIAQLDAQGHDQSAQAIRQAADALRAGDVILLEMHRPGPKGTVAGTQAGFIPVEWWEHDWAAIRYATARGVVVVEAAGNGGMDLDDDAYDEPGDGFPSGWSNPFRRGARDSRAIIVGAGAPPSGSWGPDRSRLDFSNWGSCVDAQGWGREVTTTGYGNLQGGADADLFYTDSFSGTSSASPIVTGAIACLQGIARAHPMPVLSALEARRVVRVTGSAQQDAGGRPATQRIGRRPELRAAIAEMRRMRAEDKDEKDTKDDKELAKDKEIVKEHAKEKETKEKDDKDAKEKDQKDVKDKEQKEKDTKEGKEKDKEKEQTKDTKDDKELAKDKEVLKDRKDLAKEKETGKEGKEHKDGKDGKDKEKEKEGKETKEKDAKEGKDKEKEKDRKDAKDLAKDKEVVKEVAKEKDLDAAAPLEVRVAELEQQVGALRHFIGVELRPDLTQSALRDEDA